MSGLIMSMILSLSMSQPSHYFKYIDGSNNVYTIENSTLTYDPVTKEESSSGEYDGVEYKQVTITSEQNEKAEGLFIEAVNNLDCHIETRNMGCGTIKISSQSGISIVYIGMNSEEKKNLESYLTTRYDEEETQNDITALRDLVC